MSLWPDHCVQGTEGTEIDPDVKESFEGWEGKKKIVRKVRLRSLPCPLMTLKILDIHNVAGLLRN